MSGVTPAFGSPGHMNSAEHTTLIERSRRLRAEARSLREAARQEVEHHAWVVDAVRRQWEPDFFRPLQDAVCVMHGCESRHVASFAVRKVRAGGILWLGMVEEFVLVGAAANIFCYAWQYKEEEHPRTFTLLKLGPIDSPQAAVQLFLMAKDAPHAAGLPV